MSKPDQLLAIKPPTEVRFRGPFTDVVTSELTLSNPSDKIICFKIQTTTESRYCVRPNSGIMIPNQNVTVSVMLRPFNFDPNEKYIDKFMVQSIVIPKADIDLKAVQDVHCISEKSEYQPAKDDDDEMAVSNADMVVTCQLNDNDTLLEVRVPKPSTLLFP
eukprot:XP_003727415.1 PREDICTED: vesicle-associated membrane protein-associated protein A-like [Strongylocentrotus purpuratus]